MLTPQIRIWNHLVREDGLSRYLTQAEIDLIVSWAGELRGKSPVVPFGQVAGHDWQVFEDGLVTLR